MKILGLQKTTIIDYPGRIAATVFLGGCNFRCPFCYARDLVLPEEIKKQNQISEKEFFDFLKIRKGFLEGVVLCGGEPTVNKKLPKFIKKIKKLGYQVKLDTNGSNPKMLSDLILKKLIDYVAMDVKAPKNKYKITTGLNNLWKDAFLKNIERSIKLLKDSNDIEYEFRTTIVPFFHEKEDILEIVHWIRPAKRYFLQNFRPEKTINPELESVKPYSQEFLLEIQRIISPFFEVCSIRGDL